MLGVTHDNWRIRITRTKYVCLLLHKRGDIKANPEHITKLASDVRLDLYLEKTKDMQSNSKSTEQIVLYGQEDQYVESFCNLGSIMTADDGEEADADNRARAPFGGLHPIRKNYYILLYGSETCLISSKIAQKLQIFVRKCDNI